ncbi:hypothetical protein ACVWZA_003833 [Sphingomonas sp. UYAg733]
MSDIGGSGYESPPGVFFIPTPFAPSLSKRHSERGDKHRLELYSTQCYIFEMPVERTFKTSWFAKAARKARIADAELCDAIRQVREGKADDLGEGVFKKRLNKNMHRRIVLAKGGDYWIYAYLFAKKDRANIDDGELHAFRELADLYGQKTDADIATDLRAKVITEICHADKA